MTEKKTADKEMTEQKAAEAGREGMTDREKWKNTVQSVLENLYAKSGGEGKLAPVVLQVPPKPEMGDFAFPLFAYAKLFAKSPVILASELARELNSCTDRPSGEATAAGAYVNIKIRTEELASGLYEKIMNNPGEWGKTSSLSGKRVMVEFSCPNTNKPLHLGHVRNDCLGAAVSRLLKANGADVMRVNLINNRGVHICKSMLAYMKFSDGETPESTGIKGDHFVGNWYVRFAKWEKEDPAATEEAQKLLVRWENGDPEVVALWKKMNSWTIEGMEETYRNMGIEFDRYYYESDTYRLGKDIVLDGLEKGIFARQEDGAVYVDNSDIGLDRKILLRRDGTSIYITQDIGTAVSRHEDWDFNALVYVVASEQQYHFKVLFNVLKKLGYSWADNLYHLSYGMVFLPDGKMKSREGTVVDADDLMDSLSRSAEQLIREKGRENELEDIGRTAHDIALGAVNYYMLQFNPEKDISFNPEESLSFNGNTGPYLQYMGARLCSMLEKYDESRYGGISFNPALLSLEDERELIKLILSFPETVAVAGRKYDPSFICSFLYELSRRFSRWYHDNRILNADSDELIVARVCLCRMVLVCLRNAFELTGIPFLEKM